MGGWSTFRHWRVLPQRNWFGHLFLTLAPLRWLPASFQRSSPSKVLSQHAWLPILSLLSHKDLGAVFHPFIRVLQPIVPDWNISTYCLQRFHAAANISTLPPTTRSFGDACSSLRLSTRWLDLDAALPFPQRCRVRSVECISRASLHFAPYQNSWQFAASERFLGANKWWGGFWSQVTKLDFSEADNLGTVQLDQICRLSLRGFLQVFPSVVKWSAIPFSASRPQREKLPRGGFSPPGRCLFKVFASLELIFVGLWKLDGIEIFLPLDRFQLTSRLTTLRLRFTRLTKDQVTPSPKVTKCKTRKTELEMIFKAFQWWRSEVQVIRMLRGVGRVESLLLLDLLGATVSQEQAGGCFLFLTIPFMPIYTVEHLCQYT